VKTFDEYVAQAQQVHGHICAGQILGVRMALYGLRLLGIADPDAIDRKRLVTFVEIDRCATDAVGVVTGCRLGRRSLRFRDFGKVAATFCDLAAGRAVRVAAKDSARQRARELHPEIQDRKQQQIVAYREMRDEELFEAQRVRVNVGPEELPGYKAPPVTCACCGESIHFKREVVREGGALCRFCAGERYYEVL
jgi:formylmethanofuran dehydrogenase subunit E